MNNKELVKKQNAFFNKNYNKLEKLIKEIGFEKIKNEIDVYRYDIWQINLNWMEYTIIKWDMVNRGYTYKKITTFNNKHFNNTKDNFEKITSFIKEEFKYELRKVKIKNFLLNE